MCGSVFCGKGRLLLSLFLAWFLGSKSTLFMSHSESYLSVSKLLKTEIINVLLIFEWILNSHKHAIDSFNITLFIILFYIL